jgi:acetyl esterase
MSDHQDAEAVHLDSTSDTFVRALVAQNGPPLYTRSPSDARALLSRIQTGPVAAPAAEIQDVTIAAGPTGEVALRIVRPAGISGDLPIVMYLHGGGWVLGDTMTHDRLVREIAHGGQAAVVFVEFARSPEARYPTALEQAYTAMQWARDVGTSAGLDPSRLALVGDGAGGNLVAALTMLAQERGDPQVDFQVLFYPVTDADCDTPSYRQFAEGPWLTRKAMQWFWESYAPDVAVRADPTVSPLCASLDQLAQLPPALVITAENDVVRDEGEAYAHKLMAAGVRTMSARYLGTMHDFVVLNPIAHAPAARAALAQATAALRAAFMR